eukprot:TCALIF_09569-PA protein Name:"Protein of unknown function" AED:0.16 eAED:0.16 QI:7/0.33/0.25/0.5/0.66/0.5/4/0/269
MQLVFIIHLSSYSPELVGIMHHGTIVFNNEFYQGADVVLSDATFCQHSGLPQTFPRIPGRQTVTAYSHPILLSCGGYDDIGIYDSYFKLDITAQQKSWVQAGTLPQLMTGFAMPTSNNDDIYLFGGSLFDSTTTSGVNEKIYKYNIEMGLWDELSVPQSTWVSRIAIGVLRDDNEIFLMGGHLSNVGNVGVVKYFDLVIQDLATLPSSGMPGSPWGGTGFNSIMAFKNGRHFFTPGRVENFSALNFFAEYDPKTDTFTTSEDRLLRPTV